MTSDQSSLFGWYLDDDPCFFELEDEEEWWCFDDDPDGILLDLSFSIFEPEWEVSVYSTSGLLDQLSGASCGGKKSDWRRGVRVSSECSLLSSKKSEITMERLAMDLVMPDVSGEDIEVGDRYPLPVSFLTCTIPRNLQLNDSQLGQ